MGFNDYLVLAYFIIIAAALLWFVARGGFWWKPLLILLVISLCGLSLWYPERYGPSQRLKPGLDLAGGTTLVYDVRVPDRMDTSRVIDETIAVLRSRVDPTGTRNLVWRQLAGNRIEIQMALASPETTRRREAYITARDALLEGNLSESALSAALRAGGDARTAELEQLAGSSETRLAELQTLAREYDAFAAASVPYQQAQAAYRDAQAAAAATPDDDDAQNEAQRLLKDLEVKTVAYVQARNAFNVAQDKLLAGNITPPELERVIQVGDEFPGEAGRLARADAFADLIAAHPDRVADIEAVQTTYASYAEVKGELDDPFDLITLLQGSGVLEFRIVAQPGEIDANAYIEQLEEKGPSAGQSEPYRWFAIDDIEQYAESNSELEAMRLNPAAYFEGRGSIGIEYGGKYYLLLANTPGNAITRADPDWELASVSRGADTMGQPALNFTMNTVGAQLMGNITGNNLEKQMAILLDGEVISSPVLRGKISSQGQISGGQGGFSQSELSYMLRTLRAGSLEGELGEYPISIKTTGPQLGQDNLSSGLQAAIGALVLVAIFMLLYYFLAGAIADFALVANMVIILGIMAMIQATWTLPGIAGIVLTIGMAVDANVLIFERIREERARNADLRTAIRLGYEKALSTIIDANLTTLIVCLVLGYTASAEVKGFAVVLGIGILATLFTALFCTRVFLEFYLQYLHARSLPMLPTVVTPIGRMLSPNVNWIGMRHFFFIVSAILVVAGISMMVIRGQDMLDIEFRAGTAVSFELADDQTMPIEEVRERLGAYGDVAVAMSRDGFDPTQLDSTQQEVYGKLKPIVTAADQRYERDLAEWNQAADAELVAGEKPTPANFTLLQAEQTDVITEGDSEGGSANAFNVSTLMTDSQAVSAVVKSAFEDVLDTTRPIAFTGMGADRVETAPVYIVRSAILGEDIDMPLVEEDVREYLGGVAVVLGGLDPPVTLEDASTRVERMRMQPAYENLGYRQSEVVGVKAAGEDVDGQRLYETVVVVTRDSGTNYVENPELFPDRGGLADTEWDLIVDAMRRDTSLASVNNFSPAVSGTMQEQAIVALGLSLLAVIAYIWFRFGSFRYGIAAIIALIHDVSITLGLVAISGWLFKNEWAHFILLDPFKINLAMVAAVLTIVGYSLNDTIVVFDRIRENRGRLARATSGIINDSINQTISRTVLTSGTTLLAIFTLYVFGGPGVHGFAFAMLIGVAVGTYSSVAVAAPLLLLLGGGAKEGKKKDDGKDPGINRDAVPAT